MALRDCDEEQSKLNNELKGINNGVNTVKKRSFQNNMGLFLSAREKILNNIESKVFLIKNINKFSTTKPEERPAPRPAPQTVRKPAQEAASNPTIFATPKPPK